MVILKKVAQKHGMECRFHEKPFEGINGSGKHINFSLGNATEGNLLLPGDTPPGSERSTAGHHLDLPRRPAHRCLRSDRQGRCHQLEGEGHTHHRCGHAARAADRPRRPQPHQPVRLHRQSIRVPGSGPVAVDRTPMVTISTILAQAPELHRHRHPGSPGRRHRFQPGRPEDPRGDHHGARQRRVQRRRLLGGLADRGRRPGAAQPAHDPRCAARAHHSRRPGCSSSATASPTIERCTAATRSGWSSTRSASASRPGRRSTGSRPPPRPAAGDPPTARGALAHEHPDTLVAEAQHACDDHLPAMAAVRVAADQLEGLVADDLWSLATYQEMLFTL
jgi:hypothetical protein